MSSSPQGSGVVSQGRSEHSDGTSASNPGPPSSEFRTAIATEVGSFLARALSGASRGTSGRDRLSLQSTYYIILADYQGRRPTEPLICNSFARVREHCCRGRSVFVGLPSQVEASIALRTAAFEWPLAGINASQSGSEKLAPDRPFPFPGVQDYLLEGTAVHIGTLQAPRAAEGSCTVQVIAIGLFEGKLLVCLPQTAWHRQSARRLLAPSSLKKGVHC